MINITGHVHSPSFQLTLKCGSHQWAVISGKMNGVGSTPPFTQGWCEWMTNTLQPLLLHLPIKWKNEREPEDYDDIMHNDLTSYTIPITIHLQTETGLHLSTEV